MVTIEQKRHMQWKNDWVGKETKIESETQVLFNDNYASFSERNKANSSGFLLHPSLFYVIRLLGYNLFWSGIYSIG